MEEEIKIAPIIIPQQLKEAFPYFGKGLIKALREDKDKFHQIGGIPKPELDEQLDRCWETYGFIADVNSVIENLNLIVSDITLLSRKSYLFRKPFKGGLEERYFLYARCFFYEFYRIRELFNQFSKYLYKIKLMEKDEMHFFRNQFKKIFNDTIKVRNKMIHRPFIWTGKEHQTLGLLIITRSMKYDLISTETGEKIKAEDILSKLVSDFHKLAVEEGTIMSEYINAIMQSVCEACMKKNQGCYISRNTNKI